MKKILVIVFLLLVLGSVIPAYGQDIVRSSTRAKSPVWLVVNNTVYAGIGTDFVKRKSPSGTIVYRMKTKEMYNQFADKEPTGILLINGKTAKSYNFCFSTYEDYGKNIYNLRALYIEYREGNTMYITMFTPEDYCQ